ncbi:hypothetical protein JYT96_00215 [Gammaproteobacteria bacterium AH-315-C21]|nr:hypothetical protein [Gammaproteobacteria bacterium AH-315-C21]
MKILICMVFVLALASPVFSADEDIPNNSEPSSLMTNERLAQLIEKLDDEVEGKPGFWLIHLDEFEAYVITDERAGRMRVMVPILPSEEIEPNMLERLMQSNFDSALDSRYAIANDTLWATFIHPLASLSDDLFISGIAQSVNLAATYGTTYSSGALVFNGGDSAEQQRNYYQDIIDRANAI